MNASIFQQLSEVTRAIWLAIKPYLHAAITHTRAWSARSVPIIHARAAAVLHKALAPSRTRRVLIALGLATVAVVTVSFLIIVALTQENPSWWRTVTETDEQLYDRAVEFESALLDHTVNRPPPSSTAQQHSASQPASKPWGITISPEDTNAWLNARLPEWLKSQERSEGFWHESINELQVNFDPDGSFQVGIELKRDNGSYQILSATLRPQIHDDGSLWLPATHVHIGRLALPADWLLSGTPSSLAQDAVPQRVLDDPKARQALETMIAVFSGELPVATDPTLALPDGRRIRLLNLQMRPDNRLGIVCVTLDS